MTNSRSVLRPLLLLATLGLSLSLAIGCEKTKTVAYPSAVSAGGYLASIDVTGKDSNGNPQTSTVNNYPIWIMLDGPAVSYWGALGLTQTDRVVIDSRIEDAWSGIDGVYITSVYKGSATQTTGNVTIFTTYLSADGSVLAGPVRTDLKFYNLTGPITLPFATPTPAAFTDVEAPALPFRDLSLAGMRPFFEANAPAPR